MSDALLEDAMFLVGLMECDPFYNPEKHPHASTVLRVAKSYIQQRAEVESLKTALNTPEIHEFSKAIVSEAQHQRHRWSSDHDAGKEPQDWFWLLGYLAGKALKAHISGDQDKALHHTISTAAACANWHAAILGHADMRPGIMPPG
jgi:hypothetical protein